MVQTKNQAQPKQQKIWSDIEVTSTQYNLNIAPMCFATWEVIVATKNQAEVLLETKNQAQVMIETNN